MKTLVDELAVVVGKLKRDPLYCGYHDDLRAVLAKMQDALTREPAPAARPDDRETVRQSLPHLDESEIAELLGSWCDECQGQTCVRPHRITAVEEAKWGERMVEKAQRALGVTFPSPAPAPCPLRELLRSCSVILNQFAPREEGNDPWGRQRDARVETLRDRVDAALAQPCAAPAGCQLRKALEAVSADARRWPCACGPISLYGEADTRCDNCALQQTVVAALSQPCAAPGEAAEWALIVNSVGQVTYNVRLERGWTYELRGDGVYRRRAPERAPGSKPWCPACEMHCREFSGRSGCCDKPVEWRAPEREGSGR